MELISKYSILAEIPLFAHLPPKELSLIDEKSELVEFKRGQLIYQEGAPPNAFYCVIMGRVVIFTQDIHGSETILEYLHRGKYFGIISLLTGEPHSVSAKALNDCLLLMITKEHFEAILKKSPELAIDLSQTLSRRLKRKDIHQKTIFESTIISVYSTYALAGKSVYALNMAISLRKETYKSVVLLDIVAHNKLHSIPQKLQIEKEYPVFDLSIERIELKWLRTFMVKSYFEIDLLCLTFDLNDKEYFNKLMGIVSLMTNDYHFIVLDLPSRIEEPAFCLLNQSDVVHILAGLRPLEIKKTRSLIERLKKECFAQNEKIRLIVNQAALPPAVAKQDLKLLQNQVFATLPFLSKRTSDRVILDAPESEYAKAIRRISRKEGDCQVGLALGVGAAYGFCHIGVLKVIEDYKIPIDVISGSSMGAVIASLWAIGRSSDEILEITSEFKEPKFIWELLDFTFPFLGFIKGNKLYRLLNKWLGNKTFFDVNIPLKIVASDVKKKERRVIDKGLLVDALMATCSMPGVFNPFIFKEEMLFDGGIVSPLPTEPLFEMGIKKIIAVNVTPSKEDIMKHLEQAKSQGAVETPKAAVKKRMFDLRQYVQSKLKTNILDIIFSSVEILQSEVAKKEGQLADVVLHPDTAGMHWMEFEKAEEFAKRGEEEMKRHLHKIWMLINE